jgi:hypothetical protein
MLEDVIFAMVVICYLIFNNLNQHYIAAFVTLIFVIIAHMMMFLFEFNFLY